jgi:hypothetical protein
MKKIVAGIVALLVVGAVGIFSVSCSDKEEKGSIEKMTEKAGKDAAKKIMEPIDKAKAVKAQQEARDREVVEKATDK